MDTHASHIRAISVARWFDPLFAIAVVIGTYLLLYETNISNVHLTLAIILTTSAYFILSELSRATWLGTHIPQQSFATVASNTLTKFMGVALGVAGMLLCYWLFPEYARGSYPLLFSQAVPWVLSVMLPLSFLVILFTEYRLGAQRDGTYQFGLVARLRFDEVNPRILMNGVLEWLVRLVFLTINFSSGYILIARIRADSFPNPSGDLVQFVMSLDTIIFALIIFTILPGYLFASRLIGTEVRAVDRTWFGWAITLSSYSPINAAVYTAWISYRPQSGAFDDAPVWAALGDVHPLVLYTLASGILLTGLTHLWSEATMGIRSSNLSLRGIITTGPFAFTKHPVYVSKCIQWGLIFLPVLNAIGILDALRSGLLFLLVCVVFAARALAEERLLASDPNYVAYARHMDTHSMFAWMGRVLPFMRFDWRYAYWERHGQLPARD